MSGACVGTVVGGAAGARAGGFIVGCTGLGSPAARAFWFSVSCDIKFEIVLDNSSVAALFALLIAVCCAIKSRNIDVVSSGVARGVASWLNAVISARRSSFCFVIFSISSDKAVRRSSVDTAGVAALACRASGSPRSSKHHGQLRNLRREPLELFSCVLRRSRCARYTVQFCR